MYKNRMMKNHTCPVSRCGSGKRESERGTTFSGRGFGGMHGHARGFGEERPVFGPARGFGCEASGHCPAHGFRGLHGHRHDHGFRGGKCGFGGSEARPAEHPENRSSERPEARPEDAAEE